MKILDFGVSASNIDPILFQSINFIVYEKMSTKVIKIYTENIENGKSSVLINFNSIQFKSSGFKLGDFTPCEKDLILIPSNLSSFFSSVRSGIVQSY